MRFNKGMTIQKFKESIAESIFQRLFRCTSYSVTDKYLMAVSLIACGACPNKVRYAIRYNERSIFELNRDIRESADQPISLVNYEK